MPCPTDAELRQFLAGTLTGDSLGRFEEHVGACVECEGRLVELARTLHPPRTHSSAGAHFARGSEVSRFVLIDEVGRGAMGTVFAAYDPSLDRKVALKVLDAWTQADDVQQRLLWQEARVLAQLNHPNVVTVHEAGVHDGVPFVAMEFVAGQTLDQWLGQPRTEAEVLAVLHDAGEGLHAAHQAGLVHRDFKPTNVLVGTDGRARVTDFGLATVAGQTGQPVAVAGTPAFMAPEQRQGTASPLSDQYSYCLCLALALGGVRAAPAEPEPVRFSARTSRRLRRVLARGLNTAPDARFTSMRALLDALEPPRTQVLMVSLAALTATALAVLVASPWRAAPCTVDPAVLRGAWDDELAAQVESAFTHSGQPTGAATWQKVRAGLEGWRSRWLLARQTACLEARAAEARSQEVVRARDACLDDQRRAVSELTALLRTADGPLVLKAAQAVESLPKASECANTRALLEEVRPPTDAATRARLEKAEQRLAHGKALRDVGRVKEAAVELEAALEEAHALNHPPFTSRVAFRLGGAVARQGDHDRAVKLLEESVSEGLAGRADDPASHAAVLLVYEEGGPRRNPASASAWAREAEALLRRRGGDDELRAGLLLNQALVAETQGDLTAAAALDAQSVALFERAAPGGYTLSNALLNQARVEARTGHFAESARLATRALALVEATRGPEHPNVGVALVTLGLLALDRGQPDEAAPACARAEAIARGAFGSDNVEVGQAQDCQARAALASAAVEQAERLCALAEATLGHTRSRADLALAQLTHAEIAVARGRLDDAAHAAALAAEAVDSHAEAEARARLELVAAATALSKGPAALLEARTHAALAQHLALPGTAVARAAQAWLAANSRQ